MCTGIYLVFDFFHFQKKYKLTPDRAYTPMNIYIGFTLSPKRYAMRRLKPVLNYFRSLSPVSPASPESAKCPIIL